MRLPDPLFVPLPAFGNPALSQSKTADFGDFVQPFQIEDLNIRGRLIRLGNAYAKAIVDHAYPPPVAKLIGETMALAAMLASALKYDGIFTLQAQGNGPVPLLLADVASDGGLRAYAKIAADADLDGLDAASIPQVVGSGYLAFTVDQGADTERYQGITELTGGSLADCAHNYFRQSEQIETAIILCAGEDQPGHPRAAALMVQRLPGSDDDDENWRRAVALMSSIRSSELLDPAISASKVLYRLYHEDGIRLYDQRDLRHDCRCSRQKVDRTLKSFPRDEVQSMAEDSRITVTCEFCKTDYVFDEASLDALYAATSSGENPS